jgi:thiosulfate/3-mercaptopyruvate sulfurtransferase
MTVPVRERGYRHPEHLAETDWLAERLSDPLVRVVDARSSEDYSAGHIPGAVNISGFSLGKIDPDTATIFARRVGALGIDHLTPVVVYDGGGPSQLAGMTGWAFRYFGHPHARYLDGGMAKWNSEGLATSADAPTHEPRAFTADVVDDLFCSLEEAKASVADGSVVFWDVRTDGEFDGTEAGWSPPPRLGHMPGAVHLNYVELFDSNGGTLKPADELNALLAAKGITPESTVTSY